jgi:hypothetical protein
MLALESLAAVAFLRIALLVRCSGDVDVAVDQTATTGSCTQTLGSLAFAVVKTSHYFDAIDVRVSLALVDSVVIG